MRLKYLDIWTIGTSLLFAPAICADNYTDVVEIIVDASPVINAMDSDGLGAEAELKKEFLLEGPALEAERLYGPHGDNRWSAGISQTLPVPGQFSKTSRAMSALRARNLAAADVARSHLIVGTKRLLIEYISSKKEVELYKEIADAADKLLEKYQTAFDAGEATIIDLNKIRIESVRARLSLKQAETAMTALASEIKAISPDDRTAQIALELEELPTYEKLPPLSYIMARYDTSALMRLANAEAEYDFAMASLSATELWPKLSVGYSHVYEENTHYNGFTLALQLPSWGVSRVNKTITTQQLISSEFEAQKDRTEFMVHISRRYETAKSLESQLNELAPAIVLTDNLGLLRRALEGGELSLLSYLQETQYFIEAQKQYLDLCREHALAMACLSPYM